MGKSLHQTTSFVGGETSPKVDGRVDQQKYNSWLRQSLNVISYKTGGITRRVGTQMIAPCKYASAPQLGRDNTVRPMPFIFSPQTEFMLEVGQEYIRFYSNGLQVMVNAAPVWQSGQAYVVGDFVEDPGAADAIYYCIANVTGSTQPHSDTAHWTAQTIYEVPTPYQANAFVTGNVWETDVWTIVPCQVNDVVYLVHPNYPPYSLTRFGDTDWVVEQVAFLSPALLDQNGTDTIITPSALQGNGITLTATAPSWVQGVYYTLADSVEVSGVIYDCILQNVSSSSFATDLAAGYWQAIGIFNPQQVGGTWQLAVLRDAAYSQWGADAAGAQSTAAGGFTAGTSPQIQCLGAYEVHTYGVWTATIQVQRSLDGGITFDTVSTITGNSDRNIDIQGTAAQLGIYQLVVSAVATPTNPGATAPRVVFECDDAFLYGLVQITAVASGNASGMVNGDTYQISALGSVNWSAIGDRINPEVGDIFVYNGTSITGSGGTVFAPYVATGNVITELTDSNGLATPWVSGQAYTAGDEVSYNFVNYTAINNVTSSTPPSQDETNWAQTAPGGTEYWSEAAWSNYRGFPQAVCSFQQRIIYASSGFEPQRIWGTVQNDLENFALGDQTLATDAFAFDLNAAGRGPIIWLASQTDLFAGFSGAEWVINSGSVSTSGTSLGGTITPSNINAFEQGTFGSTPAVQPVIVGNAVFFAQRQADAIRQMLFSVYTAKYMSQDLSTVADHLFPSGIVQLAYQSRWRHQAIFWAVTQQGTLCGLTYDLDQEVFGWCRAQTGYGQTTPAGVPIPPDNGFEGVAVIDGQGTSDDEVWVVTNRMIDNVQVRFMERINPNNWEETFTGAPNPPSASLVDAFYVDCGITITNPGSLTLTGLDYLNGRYVVGLADGTPFGPLLVGSGSIVLPPSIRTTVGTVQVGLPIQYAAQPMRFDSDPRMGNTQGLKKQISDVYLRVWNSMGGSISNGTSQYPFWISGKAYTVGTYVMSPATMLSYICVVAYSGTTDPSLIAYPAITTGYSWALAPTPIYNPPVSIPYTNAFNYPFAVPQLVTVPTDIRITPFLKPWPDHDPVIILTGNDALPLTCLGIYLKYSDISEP